MVRFAMNREERAKARRATWSGGLVPAGEVGAFDFAFWSKTTPAQRLEAVWQMANQWWKIENPHGPPLRLDRSAFGVRRGER